MDPNEAMRVLRDHNAPIEDRLEAGDALQDWLHRGGHAPSGYTAESAMDIVDEIVAALTVERWA